MPNTSPRNSRGKRLHVVFFTDASKTKSTSISLKSLSLIALGLVVFLSASSVSLYLVYKSRVFITQKNQYIRELKSTLAAFAVTHEKSQLSMTSDSDPQWELTRKVAKEIETPLEPNSEPTADYDTLASLQSSLSSLSSVSANLARSDKGKQELVNFAEKKLASEALESPSGSAQYSKNTGTQQSDRNTLTGVQVEQRHTTEFNGQTTLHFELVNTSGHRSQSWVGRVCGVAELNSTSTSPKKPTAGLIAIPSGQPVQTSENPANSCADGELVRFSRLRPTELIVPARQEAIKRVTIFFVESGSNRTLSQNIEL